MQESIFRAGIRSLVVTVFAIVGVGLGIISVGLISAIAFADTTVDFDRKYSVAVQPNADNVRKVVSHTAPVILKINVDGVIGTKKLNRHTINQKLIESREGTLKGDRVKGILLYVNTPGGGAIDSEEIYRSLKLYKEKYKVPVFAHIEGLCASGGMYVVSAADRVLATNSSVVGSVGALLAPFFNVTKMMEKIGVESQTVSAGLDKDSMNPFRPWKEGEDRDFKEIVDTAYQQFVAVVSANRPKLTKEQLINEYGAKLFPAPLAQEYGFIDESGVSYQDCLRQLLKQVGIEDNNYQVVRLEEENWLQSLFNGDEGMFKAKIEHQLQLGAGEPELYQHMLLLK